MGEIKVHRLHYSPFSVRVEIALKIKGVEYEVVEEDVKNKSANLLKYNPVHKKMPVLVHDGKPLAESLVIMEYIDETWKDNPLLPTDPYERAQARFWANLMDDKLPPILRTAMMSQGEEGEKAKEEAEELLNYLEKEITGKKFFGGDEIGYLDLVGLVYAYWVPVFQEAVGKELITVNKYPQLSNWTDRIMGCNLINEHLPQKDFLLGLIRTRVADNATK